MRTRKTLAALILVTLCAGALPVYADGLPDYYNWRRTMPTDRTSGLTGTIVGPVLNQSPYENCWTFATTATLESTLNIKLKAAGLAPTPALSERYLGWLAYAPPVNGGGDGFYFYDAAIEASHFNPKTVFDPGETGPEPVSVLVRYGTAYDSEWPYQHNNMQGVSLVAGRGTALHDAYGLVMYYSDNPCTPFINKDSAARDYYKKLIQNYGVLKINYYAELSSAAKEPVKEQDILTSHFVNINHAVSLVGWDDNYTILDKQGVTHTGAWLLRNSWGTNYGDAGYYYLSYDDATAFAAGVYNAETDWGRYTSVDTITPSGQDFQSTPTEDPTMPDVLIQKGGYKIADKLTSSASQLLKAVGIFVPADAMSYKIEVSLKGNTPADATSIYTQSGTFGQDGTAAYKGYRTVDFNKFIYLPNAQNYFITVTLTGQDGVSYYVPISLNQNQPIKDGVSYLYAPARQTWVDTVTMVTPDTGEAADILLPLYALNKKSDEANGDDFTVVSLNDNGVGGSEIYLGKKDELYTTDLLHPVTSDSPAGYRYTLSNMTVELTKGLTDSVYGGKISGEGSVTKTGDGILALSGANTYTGATNVNAGSLALTGSLTSPVTVANGATFTGYGTISGNLNNSGTLVPGLTAEARNLFYAASGSSTTTTVPQVGTLTVSGNFTSNGKLIVAANGTTSSKLIVGGSSTLTGTTLSVTNDSTAPMLNHKYNYLTSQNGITGNVTAGDVSPFVTLAATTEGNDAYFIANKKNDLGSLSDMTPSEQSVGGALTKMAVQAVAANPDSATAQALNSVFYQSEATSRSFTKQVTSEARAQILTASPLSSLTSQSVDDRLNAIGFSGLVVAEVALPHLTSAQGNENLTGKTVKQNSMAQQNFASQNSDSLTTSIPVTLDANNNLWLKLFKGYETFNYADELKDHSFGGAIGYDKALNLTTRVGGLFSYGITNYSTDNMSGDSHDWRVGAYVDHKNGNWDYQGLVTYGHNKYDLDRDVLGTKLNSDYKAKVWDVEAKAKYLIPSTARKTWQFTPYGKVSYTHSSQDAYGETGNSVFAQNMESTSHNSTRGEIGIEFKRAYDKNGGFGGSVGYKRVISGLNPELNGTFVGDNNNFTISTDNDRNFVTYSVSVHGKLAKNWTGQAELRGEASQNTHKEIISVAAKYSF
jgi:autotransporter-associated beta strand protein